MTASKRKGGRPVHTPTDESRALVKAHMILGTPHERISKILGINRSTLSKYYKDELENGRDQANAEVAASLYNKAIGGDTTAMIFWMKTRARWREVHKDEEETKAQPIQINFHESKKD